MIYKINKEALLQEDIQSVVEYNNGKINDIKSDLYDAHHLARLGRDEAVNAYLIASDASDASEVAQKTADSATHRANIGLGLGATGLGLGAAGLGHSLGLTKRRRIG